MSQARRSTIALKIMMAGTGLVFVGYVLLHMYGNLKLLSGEEAFNTYAEHLRTIGEPVLPYGGLLWIVRIILIVSIIGHLYSAFTLWARAGNARKHKYAKYAATGALMRSHAMRWGGVFLLLFLIWHLLEFTIVKFSVNPDKTGPAVTSNPYELVVASFQVWWLTLFYLAALVALFLHLWHGVYSTTQTLGWNTTAAARRRAQGVALAIAIIVAGGFAIPPVAILFGLGA